MVNHVLSLKVKHPVAVGSIRFDQEHFPLIVGPCSLESNKQVDHILATLNDLNIHLMRGGIWKLRTNPSSFQGLGTDALPLIESIKRAGLFLVSEVTDPRHIEFLLPHVSVFQVGARNMYNYYLLKELAQTGKPVLLKRSFAATVDEWLKAANYLLNGPCNHVILCERGIRTFEHGTRFTLDLNGALLAKAQSGLPVIVDPSHAIGLREFVPNLALAVAASGLDGLIMEVHPEPDQALSDGRQSMTLQQLQELVPQLDMVLNISGRKRC
ncbi:MAG: 3-deoxy-7-phosphoheptulonate synthase [Bdellovibrionaceae bacterium]|nr:3-deoxy-7-phosphoheptulonate synthase [Pseudobdellovibrionaceae bacterium]MDW8189723.1 3-deoxy-7-phosphoheptulonate synthase [Pseudobdellovibrionaceae bacterium]